jgi:Phage portal protein, lambda family
VKRALQQIALAGIAIARRIPFVREAMNRFDAAFQGWGERSWLFSSQQDSWLEIDAMTRQELQRVANHLVENSTVVQKIRNLKLQFSVGPAGLKVIPESSDEGFNDARSVSWETWWSKPELGSDISGAQLTRLWAGQLFDTGEVFIYKTSTDARANKRVRKEPRLQTIDSHRVKTPAGLSSDPETDFPIIDGKVINPDTGECVAYYVRKANFSTFIAGTVKAGEEEYDRLDAVNVIHKFKRRRPGQMRGIPEGFSAFNLVRDNMDLHKLEMQCAKIASEIAVVETNPSGELSTFATRRQKLNIQTQNAAGASITKNSAEFYNVTLGGKRIAMKTGDDISNFMVDRPTVVQQDYWDLHYTLICMGYNVPKLLVMPYSLQGTVTRADLDVCANAFREDFEMLREIVEEIYEWQGQWDLQYNTSFTGALWIEIVAKASQGLFTAKPLPTEKDFRDTYEGMSRMRATWLMRKEHADNSPWVQDALIPEDAHTCLIRPPRAPNVDIGYTAKALEIEMRLGVKVPQDVFADKGQDWRTQTRQMAEYVQYVNKLAKEFRVEPAQLTSLVASQQPDDKPDNPENGPGKESAPENRNAGEVHA